MISVGERCLLGANAGIGISLGDDCVVEAGLYLTAGTRVTLPDGEVVKAARAAGANGLLFRRNSQTGADRGDAARGAWGGLNAALHATVGVEQRSSRSAARSHSASVGTSASRT